MNLAQYLAQNLQESSAKSYLYQIAKFTISNPNSATYTYRELLFYIENLRKTQQSSSITRMIASLKKYYDYLIQIGVRKDNPARNIHLRDGKQNPIQLQDLLTQKELQILLEPRKERYASLGKRNQIIMSLLVNQAIKVGEIIQLKTDDIDLEKAQIKITGTAQTNSRVLPLKAEQILLFYNYLESLASDNNYFLYNKLGSKITTDDINYLVSTYQKIFAKKLTSITIRQSVITNLLSNGNDLRKVQEFAGHKQLDTTEKYKQTGIKALQDAIDKCHPVQ
jgi:site-specific recombinase XerD